MAVVCYSYAARRRAGGSLNRICAIALPWWTDHQDGVPASSRHLERAVRVPSVSHTACGWWQVGQLFPISGVWDDVPSADLRTQSPR